MKVGSIEAKSGAKINFFTDMKFLLVQFIGGSLLSRLPGRDLLRLATTARMNERTRKQERQEQQDGGGHNR